MSRTVAAPTTPSPRSATRPPPASALVGGLLSTPWPWVWFSTWVTLVCGVILGIVCAKITAAITPKPKAAAEAA